MVARVAPPLFISLVRFPSSFAPRSSLSTVFSAASLSPSSFPVFLAVVVAVVVVVVVVAVGPLFSLFTMHRSAGSTLPPCQQTDAGKKRRKRWKRTTGFFHTRTSAGNAPRTARLSLPPATVAHRLLCSESPIARIRRDRCAPDVLGILSGSTATRRPQTGHATILSPLLLRIFSLSASCVESLFSIPIEGTVQRTAGKRRGEEASEQRQRGKSRTTWKAHQQRRTRRERSNSSGVRQKREEEEQGPYGASPIEVRERLTPARPGLRTVARVRGGREGDSHGRRSTEERGEAESGGRRCRG